MLTAKQEKYVLGIVEGLTQREAYKRAYPNTKMKDKTIDENASRLYKDSKIRARYKELMEEFKKETMWTKERAVKDLMEVETIALNQIRDEGIRQATGTTFINAVKELNNIIGLYNAKNEDNEESKLAEAIKEAFKPFKVE